MDMELVRSNFHGKNPVYYLNHEDWLLPIDSPFKYHIIYLNDSLNYKIPAHKSIGFYWIAVGLTKKNPSEIIITIPVNDGGAGKECFDFALKVTNAFTTLSPTMVNMFSLMIP